MVVAPLIRTVVKGISTGIGAAGEKYYDHKERKASYTTQENATDSASSSEAPLNLVNPAEPGAETADDERIWTLDEAAALPPSYDDSLSHDKRPVLSERTVSDLAQNVVGLTHQPDLQQSTTLPRLPHPIIIPQRRPGSKARGFAHAYPPDMEAFGIDQDAFLQFLTNFEEASQASPWLKTLYLSAGIVGFIPGHITMAVSISLQVAAG